MEKIKVSVIIPVYNTVGFLEGCVLSVCRQTYRNLEIIIVDDGSTDGSGELAEKLKEADSRIIVLHQENKGASCARNNGIRAATGEYLGFVDSDDYLAPEMYAELMRFIEKENLEISQASRTEIDQCGQRLPDICIPPSEAICMLNVEFFRELLLHRGDASFCTKLIKASLLEDERFPEGVLNEDFHLLIRLLKKVKYIGILPGRYYHVNYHSGSTTREKSRDSFSPVFIDIVNNADMVEKITLSDYPALKDEAKRFALFQRLEYLLHVPLKQMNRRNLFYKSIIRYLRKNIINTFKNQYLTSKNKRYLFLFTISPWCIRKIHAIFYLTNNK